MSAAVRKDLYRKELDTISRFSSLINSSLNIQDVLNCAMQSAEEFMDAEASTVYELDEERGDLFVRLARGEKKGPVQDVRLRLGEGVAGHVVRTGKPMVVQDVRVEPHFTDRVDKRSGFKTKSMVCVPLILRDNPVGALQVLNKKQGKRFSRADLDLLTHMSRQIAVALENAKLYQRLEQRFQLTSRELRATQEKLIRSERLAAIGHLVQGVAHEIRNPIMIIGGFARRITNHSDADLRLREYAGIILDQSQRLEGLVLRVGQYIELLSPKKAREDIGKWIRKVTRRFQPVAAERHVRMTVSIKSDLPKLTVDGAQLDTALANLLENALESMAQGGKIFVEAGTEGDGGVRITIRDTGSGIATEDLDAVYDPFFSSKTQGVGLGLTMVHEIMTNHQGEVRIESRKGEGTAVTLKFPPEATGDS
jgi:hypothetical protein